MNEFRVKQRREFNRVFVMRAIFYFVMVVGALLIICSSTGAQLITYKHVFIISLLSILFCILCAYTVEKLGSGLGGVLSGWRSRKISRRDQFSADLEKARHSKKEGRFEEALDIMNVVLNNEEKLPDALFLKAQILWEGFGRSVESKRFFRRVMKLVSTEDPLYRWSSHYCDEIAMKDKMIAAEFRSKDKKGGP